MTDEFPIIAGSKNRLCLPLKKHLTNFTVLVEPQETEVYQKAHGDTLQIVTLQENDRGFGYMLNAMTRTALESGHDYFIFCDDDITGFKWRATMKDALRPLKEPLTTEVLRVCAKKAQEAGVAQYSLSHTGQSWGAKKMIQEPCGAWGCTVNSAEAIKACGWYDEDLFIFNDWEMSARLLSYGFRTCKTNMVSFVHKMKGFPGGAQSNYEQTEKVAKAAAALGKRYGSACKVEYQANHGLWEIRFDWRKLLP